MISRPAIRIPKPALTAISPRLLAQLCEQELFRVPEVVKLITLSEASVRLLFQIGELSGHSFQISGARQKAIRISGRSLIAYLAAHANITAAQRAELLELLIGKLDVGTLKRLLPVITARLVQLETR